MARIHARRIAIAVLVVGAFGAYLASIVLRWNLPQWLMIGALVAIVMLISWLSWPARPVSTTEPTSSDAYTDLILGRTPPTHPVRDASPMSQIGEALPPDPLAFDSTGPVEPADPLRG